MTGFASLNGRSCAAKRRRPYETVTLLHHSRPRCPEPLTAAPNRRPEWPSLGLGDSMPNRFTLRALALALSPFVLGQDGVAQSRADSVAAAQSRAVYASRSSADIVRQGQVVAQPTRVYLLRGLMNVWSYGMDDLGNK